MYRKIYYNFVRASSPEQGTQNVKVIQTLSGEEAKKLYLDEIKDATTAFTKANENYLISNTKNNIQKEDIPLTNRDLFLSVQNNDVCKVGSILNKYPEKINILDDYGWSLLMIACQANAVDTAKELLTRGVNISIRDKAGNSAKSLVIKNKNYALAETLLNYNNVEDQESLTNETSKVQSTETYMCDTCNKTFADRKKHLSSTIHNISASKGKKIPANFVIPPSNKGYQLMLQGGWDRQSGLGRDGSGKKYPIKTVQKSDKKGLGHENTKHKEEPQDNIIRNNRKSFTATLKKNRNFEIHFRREFY